MDENDIVYLRMGRLVICNMGVSNYRVMYIYIYVYIDIMIIYVYVYNDMFTYIATEQT